MHVFTFLCLSALPVTLLLDVLFFPDFFAHSSLCSEDNLPVTYLCVAVIFSFWQSAAELLSSSIFGSNTSPDDGISQLCLFIANFSHLHFFVSFLLTPLAEIFFSLCLGCPNIFSYNFCPFVLNLESRGGIISFVIPNPKSGCLLHTPHLLCCLHSSLPFCPTKYTSEVLSLCPVFISGIFFSVLPTKLSSSLEKKQSNIVNFTIQILN